MKKSMKKLALAALCSAMTVSCGFAVANMTANAAEAETGNVGHAFTSTNTIWGEAKGSANQSFVLKLYSNETPLVTASLNNIGGIIDGDVFVTWNIPLNNVGNDEYWTITWENYVTAETQPTAVELWVDGVKVHTNSYQLNGPDDVNKVYAATVDDNGNFIRYYTNFTEAIGKFNSRKVAVLRDITGSFEGFYGVTFLDGKMNGDVTITNTYTSWPDFDDVTVGKGVTVKGTNVYSGDSENTILGTLEVSGTYYHGYNAKTTVKDGGKVIVDGTTILRYNTEADAGIYVYGDGDDSTIDFATSYYMGAYSGTFYVENANTEFGYFLLKNSYDNSNYANIDMTLNNSSLKIVSTSDGQKEFYVDDQASLTLMNGSSIYNVRDFNVLADSNFVLSVDDTSAINAEKMNIAASATVWTLDTYNLSLTADKTALKASESVNVTVSIDKAYYSAEYTFTYDPTKFSCAADMDSDGVIFVSNLYQGQAKALATYTLVALNDINSVTDSDISVTGRVLQYKEQAINGMVNKVNGDVETITVSLNYTAGVKKDYVSGYSLVLVKGDDMGYAYNGDKMFYVEAYNAYAFLVAGAVTEADIDEAISKTTTKCETLDQSYNVNKEYVTGGIVDIKDATVAYACSILDFDVAAYMELFLRADVNGDCRVNMVDVNAIVRNYTNR